MSDFTVAAVFSDHCVLQREKLISVFGSATDGAVVSLSLFDSSRRLLAANSAVSRGGRWLCQLEKQTARDGCTLVVESGSKKISFEDISIGEVWLAGGQSNMEFELQNCTEGPEELSDADGVSGGKNVRFYYTNKIGWMDDAFFEAERNTSWHTWQQGDAKKNWSAVGYFFAKKLSRELGVTVGLIGCNWGGTSASAWMDKSYLESDVDLNTYIEEQEAATKGKSVQQQCDEYDAYLKENDVWQAKYAELSREQPTITWESAAELLGPCPWPGPKSCKNPYRPSGLYECMLRRVAPYTLKGVLWYQGESDDHKPASYYKLFTRMIDNWRSEWNDAELPFVFVQLPGNRYKADKDFKHWCLIREAQAKVHNTVKNAFMTCAAELGAFNDIHPRSKKVLGERMTLTALGCVYRTVPESSALSPMFNSALCSENKIVLYFKNAETFAYKDDAEELANYREVEKLHGNALPPDFTGFEVAGADKVFYPAQFEFGRGGTISLCSKMVERPLYARYAWYNYGPVTIFGDNGLPLAPFRSYSEAAHSTEHAQIQQIMTVAGS